MSSDGSHAWPLTNLPTNQYVGQIWARLNRAGNKLVWAHMYEGGNETDATSRNDLGSWQIKLADLVWTNGVPSLVNTQTYEPVKGTLYEPYSFSADDSRFTFASPMNLPTIWDSQIWSVSTSLTGLTRLTKQNDSNYNEFAHYTSDGDHIVVSRAADSWDTTHLGLDWWIMKADGTRQERLTYMNEPWHRDANPTTGSLYSLPIPGGVAWNPTNRSRYIGGICTDNVCTSGDAWMVTLTTKPAGAGTGLVVDAWNNGNGFALPSNRKRCGTTNLMAGGQYPIKYEYYDISGAAVAKLIWSGPSHGEEILPEGRLLPPTSS